MLDIFLAKYSKRPSGSAKKPRVILSGTSIRQTLLYLLQCALIDGCQWLHRIYHHIFGKKSIQKVLKKGKRGMTNGRAGCCDKL